MELWDRSAAEYSKFTEKYTTHRRITLLLAGALNRPKEILDFGCGPGNSTRLLSELFPEAMVTGLDTSQAMLSIAKGQTGSTTIQYVAHELEIHVKERPGFYDAIVCSNSFFHVDNKLALVGNMAAVLRPGGKLVLSLYDSVFRPSQQIAMPYKIPVQEDRLMSDLIQTLRLKGHDIAARSEDREILSEVSFSELFDASGFTSPRTIGLLHLRRSNAERREFFRIPAVSAEVFPALEPSMLVDALTELPVVEGDGVTERIVYGFECNLL